MTDDHGAIWDTQGHVVPIEWWTGPDLAHKIRHTGEDSWLDFEGFFGNKGTSNCWWHSFVGICQLVDGPPGPNRWFGDPPDVSGDLQRYVGRRPSFQGIRLGQS